MSQPQHTDGQFRHVGRYALILKWTHDFSNTNRLNGDWGQIAMSWRF